MVTLNESICFCSRYWQTCLPWQTFLRCQMWDIIYSKWFLLLFLAVFLVYYILLNTFICLFTGAPIWIPPSKYSPANPQCENKKNNKRIYRPDMKWRCLFVWFWAFLLFFYFFFFRFPPLMLILFHPRILCHPCSRTSLHRQARYLSIYYCKDIKV